MAVTKQFTQLDPINNGTTAADNFKLSDAIPAQHTDLTGGVNKLVHRTLAQSLCEPVAVCNSNNPSNGAYTATCQNYPDFALSYQDAQQNTQYLIGLKIRVIFTYGITYGSVSGGTYPTLNINGSGAIPMLAQGKTMATGSASAGQTLEFTVIPYGNGIAFDADSNVRESTSDYTIYTDGSKIANITLGYWTKIVPANNTVKIHKDVETLTNSKNIFGIKLRISGNTSINTNTHVSEVLLRLNATPYQGTTYRGLTPVLVATSIADPSVYFQTYGISFSWDANGIYMTASYRVSVEVESGFGIEYKP